MHACSMHNQSHVRLLFLLLLLIPPPPLLLLLALTLPADAESHSSGGFTDFCGDKSDDSPKTLAALPCPDGV